MFTDNVMITYGFSFTRWECSSIVVETLLRWPGRRASCSVLPPPWGVCKYTILGAAWCSMMQPEATATSSNVMQRPHIRRSIVTVSQMRQMRADSVKEPFAAGKGFAHKGPLDKPHLQEACQLHIKIIWNLSPFLAESPRIWTTDAWLLQYHKYHQQHSTTN